MLLMVGLYGVTYNQSYHIYIFQLLFYALVANCTTNLCELWTFGYLLVMFSLTEQLLLGNIKLPARELPQSIFLDKMQEIEFLACII